MNDWPFGELEARAYRVILADPPWRFSSGPSRNPRNHYECMKIADLAALPVKRLAHPDGARLMLWTTGPFLKIAMKLMDDWGFKYSTCRYWIKTYEGVTEGRFEPESFPRGTGYEVIGNIEPLLIGKVETPPRLGSKKPFSAIFGARREHSRKPDQLRKEIVDLFEGPRCELFARSSFPGFDTWGNEKEKYKEAT